eukprot:TRINITY_DN12766_c0_g1_i1.p1 TRINITY_DN12766_c0_g1~~TRINITY_DN12766_c0_g1_i1.p1  ORF type:complete len:626 (-),score=135.40 TRINITY_DN12766_c0_g1_i1:89-1966(-)
MAASVLDVVYVFGGYQPLLTNTSIFVQRNRLDNLVNVRSSGSVCGVSNGMQDWGSTPCTVCAPGSYANNGQCLPCPPGTYQNTPGQTSCLPCPGGFYNPQFGMASVFGCLACSPGSYTNSSQGAAACSPCPPATRCPPASRRLTPLSALIASQNTPALPPVFERPTPRVDRAQSVLFGVLFGLVTMVLVIFLCCPRHLRSYRKKLVAVDVLFNRSHLPITEEQYFLKSWRTSYGGLFAVITLLVAVLFVVIVSLPYAEDNIQELRSDLPLIGITDDLRDRISTRVQLVLSLDLFSGACTASSAPVTPSYNYLNPEASGFQPCHPLHTYGLENVLVLGSTQLACRVTESACLVRFTCTSCKFDAAVSRFNFRFQAPSSAAATLQYNMSLASGYLNWWTWLNASVTPYSESLVFKGSQSTNITFRLIPAVTSVDVSETIFTGYHFTLDTAQLGSQVNFQNYTFAEGLSVSFVWARTTSLLYIRQYPILTNTQFFTSLFGSLKAVISSVGVFLGLFELVNFMYLKHKAKQANSTTDDKPTDTPSTPTPSETPTVTSEADSASAMVDAQLAELRAIRHVLQHSILHEKSKEYNDQVDDEAKNKLRRRVQDFKELRNRAFDSESNRASQV